MKKNYIKQILLSTVFLLSIIGIGSKVYAQTEESYCIIGCNDNTFVWSDEPNTLEYDNMVSGFHSTILREADGTVKVWGQGAAANNQHQLSPLVVSPANGYVYKGEILKVTLASESSTSISGQQFAILTTDGLYAWGGTGRLFSTTVKNNSTFGKVNVANMINTNEFGLPTGVNPLDVKMMFGSYKTLGIVTCNGQAWMLSDMGGKNGQGTNEDRGATWTRVQTASNTNLTNVVAMRGTYNAMMALTSGGEVYTWGTGTYLGNNSVASNSNRYATKMTLPTGVTPKMIGMTYNRQVRTQQGNSYYLLSTNGDLYALGNNNSRQLGDFSTTSRNTWVRVRSNNSTNMSKIIWFSPNEHCYAGHAAVSALTEDGKLWSWGSNNGQMIGGGTDLTGKDPIYMGRGLADTDNLIAVETGGHTTMVVRECSMKYGYIGHRTRGSMGDGTSASVFESNFNFEYTAEINLCGAPTAPVVQGLLKICDGNNVDLEDARFENVALDADLVWSFDPEGQDVLTKEQSSSVGPGTYYAAYEGNTCAVIPTTKVEVRYLERGEEGFNQCTMADLYTEIDYSIEGIANASTGSIGDEIVYTVTAGNYGPKDADGGVFTFTVPVGVDITDPENIPSVIGCGGKSVPLNYNAATRTFRSELNLPDGCFITYTFTGTLNGLLGSKTAESTILRPDGVYDSDASNKEDTTPTNPHYECYNDENSGDAISCNNIQEVTFILLGECIDELLYFEDFGRTTGAINSGRTDWSSKKSLSIDGISFTNNRNGAVGGATSSYLFAPGFNDSRYGAANVPPHNNTISVARIKGGYYAVLPPGYVQMGIPESDPWHEGLWDPNASSNDPTIANSNYDWTPAWDHEKAIRDASGAINTSAFLVRGAASASQSIKPFYEFDVPGMIANGETYTLSMYSYVTYHDKDYMIMDVIDKNTGFIYASVPLTYPGLPDLPPGANPEGFSLGWVPLQASVKFDSQDCETDIDGKAVKIAIRGSQDRALESGKGFGHTLIDDISFTKRSVSCNVPATDITCEDACYIDVSGSGYKWAFIDGELTNGNTVEETFVQPGTDGGFVMDIYYLDNSFNMEINGVLLHHRELELGQGVSNSPPNVRFKSDKQQWVDGADISMIWRINQGISIDFDDIHSNPTPVIRVVIDRWGNAKMYGIRVTHGVLEELEVFNPDNQSQVENLNVVHWVTDSTISNANEIIVRQNVASATAMTVYGYGQNQKDCETCTIEKEGVYNDSNGDGFAHVGETITYTFAVKNAGDMDIHDVEIIDPLFGFTIKLDENTHLPTQEGVTFTGDINENGVLNRNETWTFTVDYKITSEDIFTNKGVYNRAEVKGIGKMQDSDRTISELSTDPTPYTENDEGWDPERPFHTYVPLKGSGMLITNPMIRQKTK